MDHGIPVVPYRCPILEAANTKYVQVWMFAVLLSDLPILGFVLDQEECVDREHGMTSEKKAE